MKRALWPMLVLPFAALPFAAQPAIAGETADFITGTYSSKEGCDALAKHQEGQGDFLFLTSKGVTGYQLNCTFVSVFARPDEPGGVAIAFCDEPGYSHPELISLKPSGQDSIDLNLPDSPYSGEGVESDGGEADQQGPADESGGNAVSGSDAQPAPDQSPSDQPAAEQATPAEPAPDASASDAGAAEAPSSAEGLASGDNPAQTSAGYVGLSGKYLRCQAPPG